MFCGGGVGLVSLLWHCLLLYSHKYYIWGHLLLIWVFFFSSLEQFQEEFEDISKEDQVGLASK